MGTVPTSGVGYYNPLRYRGYVYDTDTGWFYLNSRYYDPETGRFINADAPEILGLPNENILSYNLFTYCYNNPVMNSDPTGLVPTIVIKILAGMIVGAGVYAVRLIGRYWYKGFKGALRMWNWRDFCSSVVSGGIIATLGPYKAFVRKQLYPVAAKAATFIGWGIANLIVGYLMRWIY